jgi:hypothetical protein
MITIRETTANDALAVLNILHEAYEEYRGRLDPPSGAHAETSDSVTKLLREESGLIAEVNGQSAICLSPFITSAARQFLVWLPSQSSTSCP